MIELKALSVPPGSVQKRISFWVSKGYLKDLGDGKFKSIEPNEEILEIGKDENEETPEQLELERKKVEQEQNFEVGLRGLSGRLGDFEHFSYWDRSLEYAIFQNMPHFQYAIFSINQMFQVVVIFCCRKAVHELIIIQAVWNYIRGMLQNLGQIKLARLETMLKTFSSFNPQLKIDSASLIELLRIGLYIHLWFL